MKKITTALIDVKKYNQIVDLVVVIIFIMFGFWLYGTTIHHSYANDDRNTYFGNNFTMQGVKGIPDILKYDSFTGAFFNGDYEEAIEKTKFIPGGRYRPLSLITFAIEVELFESNSCFYSHLFNVIYNIIVAILLYFLLKRLFPEKDPKRWWCSVPFIASLLFLAHPLHTEVVSNIKGRDELFALMFSLMSLLTMISYFDKKKIYKLLFSTVFLFLAMMSKENAATFVFIIPVTIWYFIERDDRRSVILSAIPLFISFLGFAAIYISAIGWNFSADSDFDIDLLNNPFCTMDFWTKYATIFYCLIRYVGLLFFPHPLTIDYYSYHITAHSFSEFWVIVSVFLYLLLVVIALRGLFKTRSPLSYLTIIYLVPLALVSNIFFSIGTFMAERFLFFSSIAFCVGIAILISYLSKKKIILVLMVILCLYSVKTMTRSLDWSSDLTLYYADSQTSSNSLSITKKYARNACDIVTSNMFPKAEKERYREAGLKGINNYIKLYRYDPEAHYLRAVLNTEHDPYSSLKDCQHIYNSLKTKQYTSTLDTTLMRNQYNFALALTCDNIVRNVYSTTPTFTCDIDSLNYVVDSLLVYSPDCSSLYSLKGVISQIKGNDTLQSRDFFRKAISLDNTNMLAYSALCKVYIAMDKLDSANYYLFKADSIYQYHQNLNASNNQQIQ